MINPRTSIVQVDIDTQEIGRNYPVTGGIVGDAKAVTGQLLRALSNQYPEGRTNSEWSAEVAALKSHR